MAGPPPTRAEAQPHRWRWFSFSLRTMLLVSTALAVGLGVTVNDARRQEKAAVAIQAMSGQIVYDWQVRPPGDRSSQPLNPPGPEWLRRLVGPHYFDTIVEVRLNRLWGNNRRRHIAEVGPHLATLPKLRTLDLCCWDMSPEDYRAVGDLRQLGKLRCLGMTISEAGAAELARATALRELSLDDVIISPAALRHFAKLHHLEVFKLACKYEILGTDVRYTDEYKLRDDGAEVIATFPSLRALSLHQTLLTDDGVAALCRLTGLEELTVSSPLVTSTSMTHILPLQGLQCLGAWCWKISDEDLQLLQRLPALRKLQFAATPLTDDSLSHVARLHRLEWLSIDGEDITDAGLVCLQRLTNLNVLDIKDVVSDRDAPVVKLLRQALPNCAFCLPEPRRTVLPASW